MLFHVRMDVRLPPDMPADRADLLKKEEKALAQRLQEQGQWRHLWRIAGQYANVSIFDVAGNEELHALLMSLPLYPYMQIEVMPLCRHPSSVRTNDL
ncbi:muconolactone delta-isomerase [Janthinobacterium sp. TND4EL3]|uniref:muconolactone Delta-isomerase n=1 Tax=Janthinobacterium sp. TND4EL3 TaxID=1907311 RepID=UPI0009557FD0|nr:muconolactone Delta-isomerase [Janthinobacterium sp. TND4EL3]SIR25217.1 muconolactone delta-isomerase [Janthinobacterium sp. TND4EL3]